MIVMNNDGTLEHKTFDGDMNKVRELVCPKSRMLEPVRIAPGIYMWGDEEAKLFGDHSVNQNASLAYRATYGGDYMAGTVVVLADDGEGNCAELPLVHEIAITVWLGDLQRKYELGKLGPKFEATGPYCEIRELTDDDLRRMFGVDASEEEGGAQ